MSEDFGNIEAELEALIAALELAGTVADRARRDALRLVQHVRKDPPRSRKEWANRARLTDADGRDLGWLDTTKARRVDLGDATGANDRNVPEQRAEETGRERQGPGELVEVEGQFFEVHGGAGKGKPEQVRPITVEEAQARIAEHRPDLSTRMIGEGDPRLEVSQATQAAQLERPQVSATRPSDSKNSEKADSPAERRWESTPAHRAGVVAVEDTWPDTAAARGGVQLLNPELSKDRVTAALSQPGADHRDVLVELRRKDGSLHVRDRDGHAMSARGVGRDLGLSTEQARDVIADAGTALRGGAEAFGARERPSPSGASEATRPTESESETTQKLPATTDEAPTRSSTAAVGGGRSAAEAFGAVPESRDRPRGAESESAPSSAELTAVGATRPAETSWSR